MAFVPRRLALSRRTLLRGGAAAIALPWLESMRPAFAAPSKAVGPLRLAIVFAPNGQAMEAWEPKGGGPWPCRPRLSRSRPTGRTCWCFRA